VKAGRYVVTAANGNRQRQEAVAVEPGRLRLIDWLLPAPEEVKKGPTPVARQMLTTDYFLDPAGWTQNGSWWIHKGEAVSWLRSRQGMYVVEFLHQTSKIGFFKKTRHVDWVIEQKGSANRIEYSFDFGNLERRVTVDGKPESRKTKVPAATSDSYTLQIEFGPNRVIISDAQGRELDRYDRPNGAEPLGRFGFRGEVALAVKKAEER